MKNKTVAALLALFLGGIGMHKFYLGKWFAGLVYLFFCWTFIPAFLGFIEAIFLFLESEQRFQKKYGGTYYGTLHATPDTHVKCPDCRELVLKDARKCKHCGCALLPQA